MPRVTLKSNDRIYNIAFDPADTVRDLKTRWRAWEESEEGVRVYCTRLFHDGVELKENLTCSDIGLRANDEDVIFVISLGYRFEGIPLLHYPIETWKGRVVHGWVVVLRKSDETFMEARRFVGTVNSDADVMYIDDPMVVVTMHWLEKRGFITSFPTAPKMYTMHVSNLAVD
jgi:hypothetical protein